MTTKSLQKILTIFFLFFLSNNVFAKAIPPGTGEADIKNNILFLLDYSHTMNQCAGLSCADNRPNDVAIGYNGDIYVVGGYGGNLFRYSAEGTFQNTVKVKTNTMRMFGCGMDRTDETDKFIYCADWAYSWIAKICTGRVLDTQCSSPGYVVKKRQVSSPLDVAVHSSGDWMVSANCSGVRKYIKPTGNPSSSFTDTGVYASTGCPDFITFDDSDNWYTTIWYGNRTQKWSGTNSFTKKWQNNSCRQSEMTAYTNGSLYVTERGYGKICKINVSNGSIITRYGNGEGNGPLQFKQAWGGNVDPTSGNILIADTQNKRIQTMTPDGEFVSTFTTGDATKLQIAKNAIKTIMNDAELNESARFGLMAFHRWAGEQKMFVPVSDQGKSDIVTYIETALSNPSGIQTPDLGTSVCDNYWGAVDTPISIKSFNKSGSPLYSWQDQMTPALTNATGCQKNFVVLLLGSATSQKIQQAKSYLTKMLEGDQVIKTFIIAIGSDSSMHPSINQLATVGGTGPAETPPNPKKPGVLYASDQAGLVQKLREALRTSVNSVLTFASPTIDLDYTGGTEQTYVMQATFSYKEGSPWEGKLSKYKIEDGVVAANPEWKGHEILNATLPTARKMFTVEDTGGNMEVPISSADLTNSYSDGTKKYLNNFHPFYASYLKDFMCDSNLCDERDIINLINYIRGWDTYDENYNCTGNFDTLINSPLAYDIETNSCIRESRGTFIKGDPATYKSDEITYKLFDIYHSKPLILEPPSAPSYAFAEDSETKYRFMNGYDDFKYMQKNRKKIVLVGSNGGMLHAFNYANGAEEWSFIPPSLLNKFESSLSSRKSTNTTFASQGDFSDSITSLDVGDASEFPSEGVIKVDDEYMRYTSKTDTSITGITRGFNSSEAAQHLKDAIVTNVSSKQSVISSMYGVDGSPVVKDILTVDDGCDLAVWKSIVVVPLGRGGNSYTALDITNVDKPLHLFTIENDKSSDLTKTSLWHTEYTRVNCAITAARTYKKTTTYAIPNVQPVATLTADISTTDTSIPLDDASGYNTEGCPQKCWISVDGEVMTYSGISDNTLTGVSRQDEANDDNPNSMNATHSIGAMVSQPSSCGTNNTIDFNATKQTLRYDYSALGQAWGKPDIYLLDLDNGEKRWVAIIGGGYNGGADCNVGSAIYLLNLENYTSESNGTFYNGSIAKKINIPGGSMSLPNSMPGDLTVITNDASTAFDMEPGALVYFADINNRVWKVDLTKTAAQNDTFGQKKLLFDNGSDFIRENRNFQRILATIDETTQFDGSYVDGILRLYYGTGNVQNIGEANTTIQNYLYGLTDPEFPYFGNQGTILPHDSIDNTGTALYDTESCFNGVSPSFSSGNKPQYDCPDLSKELPGWKVTLNQGERVVGEKALLTGGYLYFSIYEPNMQNSCEPGDASMGVYNYMCPAGSSVQINLGKGLLTSAETDGEFIYFGQSNVSDAAGDKGQVITGSALGDMADASGSSTAGQVLGDSVTAIDEGGTGELTKMGVAQSSKSQSMDRSWRELR